MSKDNKECTGTNTVETKPKKGGKSAIEKLQTKFDKLDNAFDSLQDELNETHDKLSLELERTRSLEAQIRNAVESKESAGYDTARNANARLLIETYLEEAEEDDEKTIPVSRLSRINKQLTKDLAPAALQIQAH